MMYVVIGLWILIWFAAGYFTVRAIQMHIERKRIEKALAARVKLYAEQLKNPRVVTADNQVVYNPFEGILKN